MCFRGGTLRFIYGWKLLDGTIEESYSVFPAIGMLDTVTAHYARIVCKAKPESEQHSMCKVFER